MRINNYRGTVADKPIDTQVIEQAVEQRPYVPAYAPNFMDKALAYLNSQNNVVPAGNLPVYNKG